MLHRLLRNSRPVRARIAARLARPCVGAFWRPVTRRGYHCGGKPGSAKGKPALVDRQNRRWLPGRFVVAGFGAVSKKCCLLRWDRGFESVFLQRGVSCEPEFRPASRTETQAQYQTAWGHCTSAGNRSVGGPETQPCERSAHVEAEDNAGSKAARAVSRSASGSTVIALIQRSKWQARGPGQPHCPL